MATWYVDLIDTHRCDTVAADTEEKAIAEAIRAFEIDAAGQRTLVVTKIRE
jgi:hypothetical protein